MTEWSEIKRYIPAARDQRNERYWTTFFKDGRSWCGLGQPSDAPVGREFLLDGEFDALKETVAEAKAIFKARDPSFYGKHQRFDRYVIEITLEVPPGDWWTPRDAIYVSERVVWSDYEPHPLEMLAEEAPEDEALGYVAA